MELFLRLSGFIAVLLAVSVLGAVQNARAADPDLEEMSTVPTDVTAGGKIFYDQAANETTMSGGVVVEQEGLHLSADTIRVNHSTGDAVADGNVQAAMGEDNFSSDRMETNLNDLTGAFYDGTMLLERNNQRYYIWAGKIEKTGPDSYLAEDVVVTTCEGESPAWKIGGKKLDITIEGYGTMSHALLRVKDVPAFYFPFLAFPVKLERQSGLLLPSLGYSDRKGFRYAQPYFWAISDSTDATIYADYMSERGVKSGIEYRYFLSDDDKGVAMFDFLNDRKVDDGTGTTSQDWGYPDDGYLRPNSDRYWLRMKHDQVFGQSGLWLDLDVVSDQDYLYDFKNGYSGYTDTRELFEDVFSRSLDDYNDPVRKNRLGFSTQWPGYSLNAEALWWDDVIARRLEDTDDTVQSLPAVYFEGYKQPLFGTGLYAGFKTQAAYYYRQDGQRGGRIDLYPRLSVPLRFGSVLSAEPSVGGRETLWQVDQSEGEDQDGERTMHRELYDFKLDLSSEIYNVFKPGWGDISGLKHAAKFKVEYDYTPTLDQDSYPYFNGLDRIDGENLLTYSVVNTFTTRRGETGSYRYHQTARFEVSQSYDLARERAGDPEPFNPIKGDLQLDLGDWFYLRSDASWSQYEKEFISHNIYYRFSDGRGDQLVLQHRYAADLRETILAAVTLKISDRLRLFSEYERNLKDDLEIGRSLMAEYRAQCWALEASYEEENDDRSIGFMVTLYGLGSMGGD